EIFQRVNLTTGLPDNLDGVAVNTSQFQVVHPTFLYELIWDLLIALLVVVVDRRLRLGHGRAFALYAAGYAFGRFWIELVRTDQATRVFGVRINVWTMSLIFICAVIYFVLARSRGPREDPATFPGTVAAAELAEKSTEDTSDVETDEDSAETDEGAAERSREAEAEAEQAETPVSKE
ncbi:MAG TPA: prolipoprotein diacylglyceryl transferase family protein, partial [Pseudonocardiaceae bacterium]|nr:prolipoprotein diacylglyceryl transferase family protein [Pseudonocardiaceae bacterium]